MERVTGRKNIREALENAGVTNIDSGMASSYLPKTGQFTDWEIVPKNEKAKIPAYPIMTGTNGTRVSLGTMKTLGIVANGMKLSEAKAKLEKNPDGKYFLKGMSPINSNINGSKDAVIDYWIDKHFTATPTEIFVLNYKEGGYTDKKEAEGAIVGKTVWRIEEIENPFVTDADAE